MDEVYGTIREDLSAFADDDNEVEIDRRTGQILMIRGGLEISCQLRIAAEGGMQVETDGIVIPYRRFLQNLAHLDIFAQKLLQKRHGVPAFVDSPARLIESFSEPRDGNAVELLDQKCRDASPFTSRVVFITADAGHGKTALLRQYQRERAEDFVAGKAGFLFWHVDLQGRQLVRLSEALMGDLGDLRMSGIWMPTIIRLLRHRLLVLAIDGFDELAAEQGDKDALGALALLVREMRDQGTIIAASRRTFFDTEDYLKRSRVFRQTVTSPCDFDQLHLMNWRKAEGISYLSKVMIDGIGFDYPEVTYEDILVELNGQADHPMVSRPFLLTYLARMLLRYGGSPADFIRRMDNPMEGVASVVKAFVDREVKEKWKSKETGEPYLTADQHMLLLAAVAEEMWREQKERLKIDVIMTIAEMLLDGWGIVDRRQQIVNMIKMHVLLIPPQDAPDNYRGFDHPEFRNYFIAYALAEYLKNALDVGASGTLSQFLSVSQFPDSVARYATGLVDTERFPIPRILDTLRNIVDKEWRQTYLHSNVGTIVPYLLDGYLFPETLVFDAKLIYSSLVFEGTKLKGVEIRRGQFVHTSFLRVTWEDVRFVDCDFTEVSVDQDSTYARVVFDECSIKGLRIFQGDEEIGREYSPVRVTQLLANLGILVLSPAEQAEAPPMQPDGEGRKLARRVLRVFRRTTGLMDNIISMKFSHDHDVVRSKILPLMEEHGILTRDTFRGGGKPQDRWILARGLDEILRADGGPGDAPLVDFWRKVDE